MDYKKISNIVLDGIETVDYPEFCNAFIVSADYYGKEMTDEQLDELNNDTDFIYSQVENYLY